MLAQRGRHHDAGVFDGQFGCCRSRPDIAAQARSRRARGRRVVMARDRNGRLLDQHAKLADLADDGLGVRSPLAELANATPASTAAGRRPIGVPGRRGRRSAPTDRRSGRPRVGAIAQPHRHRVVENRERSARSAPRSPFLPADAAHPIQVGQAMQQPSPMQMAMNRGRCGCVFAAKPPCAASLALLFIRKPSVLLARRNRWTP